MKKSFYIALALIIASCVSNTPKTEVIQNSTSQCSDLQSIQLKGKIRSTRTRTYKNAILKNGIWTASDTATYVAINLFYNERGFITKQIDSSFDNGILKYTSTRTSHYNEYNTLTSQEIITSQSSNFRIEYTYPATSVAQALVFNENGKMIEKIITKKDSDCVMRHIQNYHYDTAGRLAYALQTDYIHQPGILTQERTMSINDDGSRSKDDTSLIIYNVKEIDRDKYNPTTLVSIPENNIEDVKLIKIEHTYY